MKPQKTVTKYLAASLILICLLQVEGRNASSTTKEIVCPKNEDISPCLCGGSLYKTVTCSGRAVTEESITRVFRVLREVNVLSKGELLSLSAFKLENSLVKELDWTPFLNTSISSLEIFYNNFSDIRGPPQEENQGRIRTFLLHFQNNNFRTMGQSLKYFSPDHLALLWIEFGGNVGFEVDFTASEFLPGLFTFDYLQDIKLTSMGLERLGSLQFSGLKRLTRLNMEGNRFSSIPKDAFKLGDPPTELMNVTLVIQLGDNPNLTENSFLVNSSLNIRPIRLVLARTKITTLPQNIFEPFLDAHKDNQLTLYGCPIKCDRRLLWLKERRSELESRVLEARCVDDPYQTIFTSDLEDDEGNGSNPVTHNVFIIVACIMSILPILNGNIGNAS